MEKEFVKEEIKIIYKLPKKERNIKIYGKDFVKNNKDNCY